jgi:hypothetical protein
MTFDDQLRRAFDTLSDRLRGEIDRQVRSAIDELSASARAETDAAVAAAVAAIPAPPAVGGPAPAEVAAPDEGLRVQDVLDGIHAIDRTSSLTAVLDALLAAVSREDRGAGVWLVRGARLQHWRSVSLDAPPIDVPIDAGCALAEAARTRAPATDDDGFAVPIALAGQVVAVLHASSASSPSHAESNVNHESRAHSASRIQSPESIEVLTRYAARSLEALTAFKAARAMTERAEVADSGVRAPVPATANEVDTGSEEHVAARRYARLLVSEIKLYHQDAVMEGRRDRDLAARLGGEIARARVMYDQRVPPEVRQHADHFHDELVRTLADGDAGLLEVRS